MDCPGMGLLEIPTFCIWSKKNQIEFEIFAYLDVRLVFSYDFEILFVRKYFIKIFPIKSLPIQQYLQKNVKI